MPLLQGPGGAADGVVNPFYSEKLQSELRLQALRPLELPRDDEGAQPVAAGRCGSAAQANGKGRGDGMVMFTTPSSWEEAGRRDVWPSWKKPKKWFAVSRGNA